MGEAMQKYASSSRLKRKMHGMLHTAANSRTKLHVQKKRKGWNFSVNAHANRAIANRNEMCKYVLINIYYNTILTILLTSNMLYNF